MIRSDMIIRSDINYKPHSDMMTEVSFVYETYSATKSDKKTSNLGKKNNVRHRTPDTGHRTRHTTNHKPLWI